MLFSKGGLLFSDKPGRINQEEDQRNLCGPREAGRMLQSTEEHFTC